MKRIIISAFFLLGMLYAYCQEKITHYVWIDQHPPVAVSNESRLNTALNVADIIDGLHTLGHIAVTSEGKMTSPVTTHFYKDADFKSDGAVSCHVFIDDSPFREYNCDLTGGLIHMDLDMAELTDGLHRITMQLVSENNSTVINTRTAFFVKVPIGGNGIAHYCYWINSDTENAVLVVCNNQNQSLNLVDLIEVAEYPFATNAYSFGIEDTDVVMSALHTFNFWAADEAGRISQTVRKNYTDKRTQRRFPIENIEKLTTCDEKPIGRLNKDEVKWFRFDGEVGDSLSINLSENAMFELYSSDGIPILQKKGAMAKAVNTYTLTKTCTYYMAIHDIASTIKNRLKLNFHHVPRNAILNVSPNVIVASKAFSFLDIFGNGMNDITKIIIENNNGVRYEINELNPIDNYHLSVVIGEEKPLPLGDYHLSAEIIDKVSGKEKTIAYSGIIQVKETCQIEKAQIDITIVPSYKAATPYIVNVNITNNSDVHCWGIPFNVACDRNKGKNGFVFYMTDFLGGDMPAIENLEWYEVDNMLGTGNEGIVFPMIIASLSPHETRTLKVGITGEPHSKAGLYAWSGEPYNEAIDRILSLPADSIVSMNIKETNLFTFENQLHLKCALEDIEKRLDETSDLSSHASAETIRRAPVSDDDSNGVLEFLDDYGTDVIGYYCKYYSTSVNAADVAAALAKADGKTIAGIVNALDNRRSFECLRQEGVKGNTVKEQLDYIYKFNMQNNDGIKEHVMLITANMARSISPRDIVLDTATDPLPWWGKLTSNFMRDRAKCSNPMPTRNDVEILMNRDPNKITGPTDTSGGNYIGIAVDKVNYTIEFENDPEFATAPASNVIVTNQFDANMFDLESLTTTSIVVGKHKIEIPATKSFVTTTDMRPEINCILESSMDYSKETGLATWTFTSLDPITLEAVDNSLQGFLPVNDATGCGTAYITYSIGLNKNLNHNSTISNKASIVFDENEPMETPAWINITDYKKPKARIAKEYEFDGTSYAFDVETSDEGSGIKAFDLYARTGNNDNWSVVKANLSESHVNFDSPEPIENVKFMVLATDHAGNRQTEQDNTLTGFEQITTPAIDQESEIWYDLKGVIIDDNSLRQSHGTIILSKDKKVLIK